MRQGGESIVKNGRSIHHGVRLLFLALGQPNQWNAKLESETRQNCKKTLITYDMMGRVDGRLNV